MTPRCCRCWITMGAVLMGLGIIGGAYAAHGIDERLEEVHSGPEQVDQALANFRTGVRYHVWHAGGLVAVGLVGMLAGTRAWALQLAGWAFGLGIVGFSGALYSSSLTGSTALNVAAPVGGSLMIVSWFLLAAGACPCGAPPASETVE